MDLEVLIAEKAKKVKQSLLDTYFDEKRTQYFQEFIDTSPLDSDKLFDLKYKVDAINDLAADIDSMIEGGKVAQLTTGE